jgi:hypothetical protein
LATFCPASTGAIPRRRGGRVRWDEVLSLRWRGNVSLLSRDLGVRRSALRPSCRSRDDRVGARRPPTG